MADNDECMAYIGRDIPWKSQNDGPVPELQCLPDSGVGGQQSLHSTEHDVGLESPSKRITSDLVPLIKSQCRIHPTSKLNGSCLWVDLPPDLMGIITTHLSPDEIQMARLVCRDWRRIISASVISLKPHYFDGTNYHEVFSQVTRLDLRNCASTLSDRALVCGIQPFNRLHKLDLSGCTKLTDESIQMLFNGDSGASLKRNLTWLSLQNVVKITDESIFALCGVFDISKSIASFSGNSSAGMCRQMGQPRARRMLPVSAGCSADADDQLAAPTASSFHRNLFFHVPRAYNKVPHAARSEDQGVPRGAFRLEYLDLSGCFLLSGRSMSVIRQHMPNLKDLRLGGYSRTSSVGDSMLLHLAEADDGGWDSRESSRTDARTFPPNIQHLDLSGCIAVTSLGLEPVLTHMHKLKRLNLWNCMSIRSSSLEAISCSRRRGACQELRELSLRGCHGVDDTAFQHIAELSNLEVLDVRSCEQISGRLIGQLRRTKLRHLNMKSCFGLTDLSGISRVKSLELLNLSDCWQIQVEQLGHLAPLSNLLELNLSGCRNICNASGMGLPALSSMKRLERLSLHCCERLQEGALSSLARLPNLQQLDISRCCQLPASDLKHLWKVESLRRLVASHCPWSGCSALRSIGSLTRLEELYLQGCPNLVGTSFEPLKRLKQLKQLNLDGCSNIPLFDRGLVAISTSLKSLTNLSLQNCVTVGDAGIASLGQLENLEVVNLSDCYGITGDGFHYWNHMQSLRVVILQGCGGITDKGIKYLVTNNSSILELNLKQCRRITDKSIFCIVNHLPRIKSLSLQASMGVTDEGILYLAERSRKIQSLAIQFCWQFGDLSAVKLAELPWLRHLDLLYSWKITDASIDALAASNSLVELNIFGCHRVTCQARQRIASKLSPMCQ